jgi:hypothetical protein
MDELETDKDVQWVLKTNLGSRRMAPLKESLGLSRQARSRTRTGISREVFAAEFEVLDLLAISARSFGIVDHACTKRCTRRDRPRPSRGDRPVGCGTRPALSARRWPTMTATLSL